MGDRQGREARLKSITLTITDDRRSNPHTYHPGQRGNAARPRQENPRQTLLNRCTPAPQTLDRGSSTTNSSLVLTNARISARSTVVTEGPGALTCLAGNTLTRHPVVTECGTARAY